MDFLKKLLGISKNQSLDEQQSKPQATTTDRSASPISATNETEQILSGEPGELQKIIIQRMEILRFLCNCEELDRDKLTTFFTMAEKAGMLWAPEHKQELLNATFHFAPKRKSDGTVMNGFEQVRVMLIETQKEGLYKQLNLFNLSLPLNMDITTGRVAMSFLEQTNDFLEEVGA